MFVLAPPQPAKRKTTPSTDDKAFRRWGSLERFKIDLRVAASQFQNQGKERLQTYMNHDAGAKLRCFEAIFSNWSDGEPRRWFLRLQGWEFSFMGGTRLR